MKYHTYTSVKMPSPIFYIAVMILLFMVYEIFIDVDPPYVSKRSKTVKMEKITVKPNLSQAGELKLKFEDLPDY